MLEFVKELDSIAEEIGASPATTVHGDVNYSTGQNPTNVEDKLPYFDRNSFSLLRHRLYLSLRNFRLRLEKLDKVWVRRSKWALKQAVMFGINYLQFELVSKLIVFYIFMYT